MFDNNTLRRQNILIKVHRPKVHVCEKIFPKLQRKKNYMHFVRALQSHLKVLYSAGQKKHIQYSPYLLQILTTDTCFCLGVYVTGACVQCLSVAWLELIRVGSHQVGYYDWLTVQISTIASSITSSVARNEALNVPAVCNEPHRVWNEHPSVDFSWFLQRMV